MRTTVALPHMGRRGLIFFFFSLRRDFPPWECFMNLRANIKIKAKLKHVCIVLHEPTFTFLFNLHNMLQFGENRFG